MTNVVRVITATVVLLSSVAAGAQEWSLAAARDLYAAAEYSTALTMLNALAESGPSRSDRQAIELHRALCLVALGNQSEATKVIEGMVSDDPLYRPDFTDLPPRMRTAFTDARKRLLPSLVQQRYIVARTAFEQKEYATAAEGFKLVLDGLADPELGGAGAQPPLSDLKVLASGFHELASKATAPKEPEEPEVARTDVVGPAEAGAASGAEPKPAGAAGVAGVSPAIELDTPPVAAGAPRIYGGESTDVVPPTTIRQVVPPFPNRMLRGATAAVEVVINETGSVDSAVMILPLNPVFDRNVLEAARTWQYRPATLNGTPVKYRKRLMLAVMPGER